MKYKEIDKIFNILLKDKQIKLSDNDKILSLKQRKKRECYKYGKVYGH